jgi:putative Mg2+ transporter-C (MgtC) family protein
VKIYGMNVDHPGLDLLFRVGLALLLGIAIGAERQWRSRTAGLQTMALVSMGSALFTIMGAYDFPTQGDRNRVAAQIVTGIGFLGAGVIIKEGLRPFGLNTAATLWAASAVGTLCGVWMWREAVVGAFLVVAANGVLYPLSKWIDRRPRKAGGEKQADF